MESARFKGEEKRKHRNVERNKIELISVEKKGDEGKENEGRAVTSGAAVIGGRERTFLM